MKSANWIQALALATLLASACGSQSTGHVTSGSRTTPTSESSPAPTAAQCTPPNRCLALVQLRGSDSYVVRDITDIRNPKTVGRTPSIAGPSRFISATEVSWADNGLYRAPLAGFPAMIVASNSPPGISQFDWSPDGTTAIYALYHMVGGVAEPAELHTLSGGTDRKLASMPAVSTEFGCETQECADRFSLHLAYSPNGQYISWAQNINPAVRLWTSGGKEVALGTDPGDVPFMLVWSGSALYFRDSRGVEVYRNGKISSFLPGVAWIRPKASPGGGQIVYEARDATGLAHAYLVDTKTGQVRDLGAGRAEPAFLTYRFIWTRDETTGKTYIYDLQDRTDSPSVITAVYDVWPHPA